MQRELKNLILSILLPLLIAPPGFAALPTTTTVWEVQSGGNATNGGCFISGSSGTDLTYPTSSPVAYTDLVAVTATTITSAATPFSAASVGNCLHIASGTGWTPGWYYIVSVTVVTATVDSAIATLGSTGGTGTLGGAFATPTTLNGRMTANHTAYVKAATYAMGANNRLDLNFSSTGYSSVNGYTSTRGDNGQATIQCSGGPSAACVVLGAGNVNFFFRNFIIDLNGTNVYGLYLNTAGQVGINIAISGGGTSSSLVHWQQTRSGCIYCTGTSAASGAVGYDMVAVNTGNNFCYVCAVIGGAYVPGFNISTGYCVWCIAAGLGGATSDGFSITSNQAEVNIINSIAVGNGRDGIRIAANSSYPVNIMGTIMQSNTGSGMNSITNTIPQYAYNFYNNAFFSNGTNRTNVSAGIGDVVYTADAFTNTAGRVFTLNSTAGGGAALKALGFPGTFPSTFGIAYPDIGALQSAAPPASTGAAVGFVQ